MTTHNVKGDCAGDQIFHVDERLGRMLRGKSCGLYQWTPAPLAFSSFRLMETLTRDGRTENKIREFFSADFPGNEVALGC